MSGSWQNYSDKTVVEGKLKEKFTVKVTVKIGFLWAAKCSALVLNNNILNEHENMPRIYNSAV
jgi:hypothetical protein